jgi:hypothetical protein
MLRYPSKLQSQAVMIGSRALADGEPKCPWLLAYHQSAVIVTVIMPAQQVYLQIQSRHPDRPQFLARRLLLLTVPSCAFSTWVRQQLQQQRLLSQAARQTVVVGWRPLLLLLMLQVLHPPPPLLLAVLL